MVCKCISCLKPWKLNANRSFHRFPREIMQHSIWLQNLGLCEEDIVKVKDALVRSDHFSSVDVSEYASAGRIRLKFNAFPKSVSKNIVLDSMQKKIHSSSSTLTASSFDILKKNHLAPKIVLCGYEGYTEFFNYDWLHYILKAQRENGCYPATLSDNLKTRLKRNYNIFEDGCADHTTGVGTAILALHYNYILKQNIDDFALNLKAMVYEE